ncbi:MAG: PhzF family phenazine biosynthesis protein [Gammaproteobacteria bacterium]|nr:PhzF family phenazine biosynthesis protein [Gammaproteobacteria bacterium]
MTHSLYIVDVFAEHPYTGNQLAVVGDADNLSDETMQRIAAEMNFSETTFVSHIPESNGGYRVRIFTPAREIPFAGHPILGTAWVIRHRVMPNAPTTLHLNITIGQVHVTFETSVDGGVTAWFLAPPVTPGRTCTRESISTSLGLLPEDIETKSPIQQFSAGVSAVIVPLRNLDALRRCRLDLDAYAKLKLAGFPPLVYLFCPETHSPENDLCARFFFEAHGLREDPATGNGAAFLGAYLLEHRCFGDSGFSLRIEQGYEVQRPSLILLRAQMGDGGRDVRVGGSVIPVAQGELLDPPVRRGSTVFSEHRERKNRTERIRAVCPADSIRATIRRMHPRSICDTPVALSVLCHRPDVRQKNTPPHSISDAYGCHRN